MWTKNFKRKNENNGLYRKIYSEKLNCNKDNTIEYFNIFSYLGFIVLHKTVNITLDQATKTPTIPKCVALFIL